MIAPRWAIRASRTLAISVATIQVVGCVSAPPPRDLDVGRMELVVVAAPPRLDISGLRGGKAAGAGVGAGTGIGAGALIGAASCIAAGPLVGVCMALMVPAVATAGAVTGGVVGAVKTESVDALERKTQLLSRELAATAYQNVLVQHLHEELRAARGIDVPVVTPAETSAVPTTVPTPWSLSVAVTEVGTEGKSEFAVRLVTRAELRRAARPEPVWSVTREVQSETELTTSAWLLSDARALRLVLDLCARQAAHEIAIELMAASDAAAGALRPRVRHTNSCQDVADDVVRQSTS